MNTEGDTASATDCELSVTFFFSRIFEQNSLTRGGLGSHSGRKRGWAMQRAIRATCNISCDQLWNDRPFTFSGSNSRCISGLWNGQKRNFCSKLASLEFHLEIFGAVNVLSNLKVSVLNWQSFCLGKLFSPRKSQIISFLITVRITIKKVAWSDNGNQQLPKNYRSVHGPSRSLKK